MALKSNQLLRFLSLRFLLGMILLGLFVASYWQWLNYQQFLQQPINFSTSEQVLLVNRGESVNLLSRRWQKQGLISNQYYLRFYCLLNPEFKSIKKGEYRLAERETPRSLMTKLSKGQVIQYPFTIVEGMNSFQILRQIQQTDYLVNDLAEHPDDLLASLDLSTQHIEGWLFPETYYYTKNASARELLKRAANKMQQVLASEWQQRDAELPYDSAYQALIMASIIEKETGIESERQQIAGVFVRRLQKNMRLQTDPTVIYGIGPEFNGDITFKDLREKTPYNTYVIKGLPPTPIAMPGRESIYAALHPADGDALYFVATGDGGHQFSATLPEHRQAVREYLKKSKQRSNR